MQYEELTKEDLISEKLFEELLNIKDSYEHTNAVTKCIQRARELKITNDFNNNFKQFKISKAIKRNNNNGNLTDFIDQPIQLNCGEWQADGFGVKKNEINLQNGSVSIKWASPIPILPTQILENLDSGIEKIRIDFFKDSWKYVICERSKTANQSKIIELADKGIEVNSENSKLLVKYIADCVSNNLDVIPRYQAVSRLGWLNDKFMPYDSDVKFDGEKENKYLFEAVEQAGSYERWVECTSELRKNKLLRLQMAASFASPLIEKVNALPFVFHLWGGTGSGKTVGLMVAMSIWGNPKMGKMTRTMNMTQNSMLSTAAFLCNIPFGGDELQTIKSTIGNYDTLIMKICEGIDRGRMSYNSNNELKAWKCSFIFTGEEACTKSASGGGVLNRVIEIECDNKVIENGNKTINLINKNFGYAGIEYIKGIIKEKKLIEQYTEIFNQIMEECDTEEKQALSMALILLADKLATKYIYTDEKPFEISDISMYLKTVKEIDISERAYSFVINFIAKNNIRFEVEHNSGEVWGKIEGDYIYINKDVLCKNMSLEGFEFDSCKKKWTEKGYLILNSQGRFLHQTKVYGIKASYIKIKNSMIEDETFINPNEVELPY